MEGKLLDLLEGWSGEGVVMRHDAATGSQIFIALHDGTLGPMTGGTRMKSYPEAEAALRDAMRLAEGMTYKWASLGMPYGGGKAVLDVPSGLGAEARLDLLRRYGAFVDLLRGTFLTGADLGMSAEDMAVVAERSTHVLGIDYEKGGTTDPGPFTARGVFAGLVAAVEKVFGSRELLGRRVAIQGLGRVGGPLADLLAEAGAEVVLADIDEERAARLAAKLGAQGASHVGVEDVYVTECDVFAPCAIGGTLNSDTIPTLKCRVVAGSANNQLLSEDDAERLSSRGILYIPDYILNAGGAMAFALMHSGERDRERLMAKVGSIGASVERILGEAERSSALPLQVARRQAERLIAEKSAHGLSRS